MYLITTEQILLNRIKTLEKAIPEQLTVAAEADKNARRTRQEYHELQADLTRAMRALEAIDERYA